MTTFVALWRRGWWTWALLSTCTSGLNAIVVALGLLVPSESAGHRILSVAVWVTVGAPAWGWLFEWFVRSSIRVGAEAVDPAEVIAQLKS